jgi:polar amino acid transport system substrate-binding protein
MRTIIAFVLLGLLAACGGPSAETDLWQRSALRQAMDRGRLIVATEPEFPPFESRNPDGELVGFDIDLARAIAEKLGVEIEFRDVKFDVIIAELVMGNADLIMSGMTRTAERALSVSYTDPYYETITCLLVSKDKGSDVRSVADLNRPGRVVVAKQGTTGEEAAKERCPRATLRTYPTENAAALEVAQGRADAFVYDRQAVRNHHRENPDTTFMILDPVTVEPYAIACRKGDPETIAWLNLFLDEMRRSGRLKELYERHGLDVGDAP